MAAALAHAHVKPPLSSEHFSVDGTPIDEAFGGSMCEDFLASVRLDCVISLE